MTPSSATTGQSRAFQNKYLAALLAGMLICLCSFAQVDTTHELSKRSTSFADKHIQADSSLRVPLDTFKLKSTWRGFAFKGATPYYWNGQVWGPFGGGSGSTNSNIGSGFRFAVPGTNNLKTLFGSSNMITVDSTSNSNALTFKIDTTGAGMATQNDISTSRKCIPYLTTMGVDSILMNGTNGWDNTFPGALLLESGVHKGRILVGFRMGGNHTSGGMIGYKTTDNYGETHSDTIMIERDTTADWRSLIFNQGRNDSVFMVYWDNAGNLYTRYSVDGGDSWSARTTRTVSGSSVPTYSEGHGGVFNGMNFFPVYKIGPSQCGIAYGPSLTSNTDWNVVWIGNAGTIQLSEAGTVIYPDSVIMHIRSDAVGHQDTIYRAAFGSFSAITNAYAISVAHPWAGKPATALMPDGRIIMNYRSIYSPQEGKIAISSDRGLTFDSLYSQKLELWYYGDPIWIGGDGWLVYHSSLTPANAPHSTIYYDYYRIPNCNLTQGNLTTIEARSIPMGPQWRYLRGTLATNGITSINSLTSNSITFSAGHSGSDLNIATSGGSTVVINQPYASQSQTGTVQANADQTLGTAGFKMTLPSTTLQTGPFVSKNASSVFCIGNGASSTPPDATGPQFMFGQTTTRWNLYAQNMTSSAYMPVDWWLTELRLKSATGGTLTIENLTPNKWVGTDGSSSMVSVSPGYGFAGTNTVPVVDSTKFPDKTQANVISGAWNFTGAQKFSSTADVKAGIAGVGGNLKTVYTDVGNVGGGEDDLMTYPVPGGTLSADGDYIEFEMEVQFTGADTKTLKVYFGATNLISTASNGTSVGFWTIKGRIVRTGATTQRADVSWTTSSATYAYGSEYSTPAETLSGNVTLKATGTVGGGSSNDEIVQHMMTVRYHPAK